MAAPAYGQANDQVQAMMAVVKTLTVDKLKNVLRQEGLTVSGIKSELQIRIIAHIEKLRNAGDQAGLDRVRSRIRGLPTYGTSTYPSPYSTHTPASSASPQFSSPVPRNHSHPSTPYGVSAHYPYSSNRVTFKNSAFYTITRPLSSVVECKARESTRDTVRITLTLSPDVADQLNRDPNARVMVFCAADSYQGPSRESEITFPHNVELKVNGDEVKANLRGLKNKPGSTRPADVTNFIRKKANYPNLVEMIYALTNKNFFVVVNLVQKKPIDSMVADLRRGKFISREQVLREMRNKAEDPDIVTTSTVLSLKDPLSFTRIVTPCRSVGCGHNQCFDAVSYLQLQEQAPTWTCPICNRAAAWENLVIDQYVNDILTSTPNDTEQVTIEPDGRWYIQSGADEGTRNSNPTPSEDEDDLIEIQEEEEEEEDHRHHPVSKRKSSQIATPNNVRTPPMSSREDSSAPSSSVPRSRKRRREEVIDLTLSDDDEEQQPPAAQVKRPPTSGNDSLRSRPPDRYHFQLPPPNSNPSPHHFDRFDASL